MLNPALMKYAPALIVVAVAAAGLLFGLHSFANHKFKQGYQAAISEYELKQAEFVSKATKFAFKHGAIAQQFEHEVNQQLNTVIIDELKQPLDHACIDANWVRAYNAVGSQPEQTH